MLSMLTRVSPTSNSKALVKEQEQLQRTLNYITYFPNSYKYISALKEPSEMSEAAVERRGVFILTRISLSFCILERCLHARSHFGMLHIFTRSNDPAHFPPPHMSYTYIFSVFFSCTPWNALHLYIRSSGLTRFPLPHTFSPPTPAQLT